MQLTQNELCEVEQLHFHAIAAKRRNESAIIDLTQDVRYDDYRQTLAQALPATFSDGSKRRKWH